MVKSENVLINDVALVIFISANMKGIKKIRKQNIRIVFIRFWLTCQSVIMNWWACSPYKIRWTRKWYMKKRSILSFANKRLRKQPSTKCFILNEQIRLWVKIKWELTHKNQFEKLNQMQRADQFNYDSAIWMNTEVKHQQQNLYL